MDPNSTIGSGSPSTMPLNTTGQGAALPGSATAANAIPPLPGAVGPTPPPAPIPPFWTDPVRIIRVILDLYAKSPTEAASVADFAQAKLARLTGTK